MSEIDSKARDLFLQALDQQTEQIIPFLDDACGGSAELRQRVQQLLDAHREAGNFLPPSEMEETNIQSAVAAGPDGFPEKTIRTNPESGTSIGPYKLLEPIGEGGMGTVWVASQSKPIKRKVAIKLIKPGMDTGQVLARFEAERQALAMMDHPNIARVLDGGMTEQGRPYFAMEYVKGVPLTEYCDSARLSLQERLELFVPVCHAVQHAHQKGIIHRDLKPSNILICLYDGKPVPKVIDFGLAKAMHHSLTEQSLYTAHGMMIGTPLYMSPEQAEQNNLDIDTRTDIYALGVILYELLTGTTPLEKAQMKQAAFNEVLRLIKEEEPQKPSTRLSGSESLPSVAAQRSIEPTNLARSISGDLDWVVMKALEKERSRRYETANGLAEDIRRHLCDEPVSASPPSTSYRMKKFIRRNRAGVIAASAIAVALLLGVAGTTAGMMWALSERRIAVNARNAEAEAKQIAEQNADSAKAEAARATHAEQLARNEVLRATEAEQRTAETLKQVEAERDAKEKARQEAEQLFTRLASMFRIPVTTITGGKNGTAEFLERWAQDLESDFADRPDQLVQLQSALGKTYFLMDAFDRAIPLQEKVRDYHVATTGHHSKETYLALQDLAWTYHRVSDRHEDALNAIEEALSISRQLHGPEDAETLEVMNSKALIHGMTGRQDRAIELLEELLEIRLKVNGLDDGKTATLIRNLGAFYLAQKRVDEAIKLYEDSVRLSRATLGLEHFRTRDYMNGLAYFYKEANRPDDAAKVQDELLFSTIMSLNPEDPVSPAKMDIYSNGAIHLAANQIWEGRVEDYIGLVKQMFRIALHAEEPRVWSRVVKIASLVASNDADTSSRAVEFARKAVSAGKGDVGYQPWAQLTLGMAEYRNGQFDNAIETLTQTASLAAKVPAEYGTIINQTADLYRAMALFKQDSLEQARKLLSDVRAKMKPLPKGEKAPKLTDGNHDDLILWLAFKEANSLINQ